MSKKAFTVRGQSLLGLLQLLWSDEHNPAVLMNRRYLEAAPNDAYQPSRKISDMGLGPTGAYLLSKENLNVALREQAPLIFSLGTRPSFPACKNVSSHEYFDGMRADSRLLAALDLTVEVTDQSFFYNLARLIYIHIVFIGGYKRENRLTSLNMPKHICLPGIYKICHGSTGQQK